MSDEVTQFLEQVEKLRGQQIEEDEVRARELEQYLAAKRERQARREERARSISPQKSSPANTPSPRSSRQGAQLSEALRLETPRASVERDDTSELEGNSEISNSTMGASDSPTKENEAPLDAEGKRSSQAASPRGSPLAWQRRPASRPGGARPLSMVAAQNATQRSLAGSQEPASATEQTFSKAQIAQALGSKDPTWFRQTPGRGQGSAAYRKNQVEDQDRLDMSSVRSQLPGMSPEPTSERPSSQGSDNAPSKGRLASPIPLNAPTFPEPREQKPEEPAQEDGSRSPTGRTSPVRSASPTKGMGGFVQSAMMKRSDSVKRWSVTSPPGMTRSDSVASYRNMNSRPASIVHGGSATPASSRTPVDKDSGSGFTPRAATPDSESVRQADADAGLPTSPSKTMDSRRWSPTKSSWLENALNKPESPKPPPKPQVSQPSWKADLNKNKPSSGDTGRPGSNSHKHQVSIGGLMRSSPLGEGAKTNTTGLGGIYSPPPGGNRPPFGHGAKPSFSQSSARASPDKEEPPEESTMQDTTEADITKDSVVSSASSEAKPKPETRPKPETPPKKDFRANLKPRTADAGGAKKEEPEFKNVFGNLRKTKTQNYVAPDELKDNILRGKAGLAVTGGPKKTERKDEFKEAILKKKDDFKKAQDEGRAVTRNSSNTAERPVPEGLARRAELGKIGTVSKRDANAEQKPPPVSSKKPESPKPSPGPKRISSQTSSGPLSPSSPSLSSATKSPPAERLMRVSTEPAAKQPEAEARSLPTLHKETSAPSQLQAGRAGGGKLANRFNPALAGMLARGPPPVASERGGQGNNSRSTKSSGVEAGEPSAPGPQLTHMTKGRARGPKRKAPTSSAASSAPAKAVEPAAAVASPKSPKPMSTQGLTESQRIPEPVANKADDAVSPKPTSPLASTSAPFSIQQQVAAKATLRGKPSPVKSVDVEPKAPAQSVGSFASRRPKSPVKPADEGVKNDGASESVQQPPSPRKLAMNRMSRFLDNDSNDSPKVESPREPAKLSHQRTGSRSPVKMFERSIPDAGPSSPTKVDRESVASVKNATSMFDGSSAKSPPTRPKPSFSQTPSGPRSPIERSNGSPRPHPLSPSATVKSPPAPESPIRSPRKQVSELSTILQDFFGPNRQSRPMKVDPAQILANRLDAGDKIKSQGFQMFQITGDGKKIPVPPQHERVLFEREMYLCPHDYTSAAGQKTLDVYFWVGDEVPPSTAEDAQLFVQREARNLGGRVVRQSQGKETSEFAQAMGGVFIVRRGSSTRYDSLAPNMLCGRRYLGQVAFDEVDFTPSSLCAGFPYLVTQSGKCYLWKGKGSHVDELSCARLIGMDLTLTGELIEYEDGSEPASFWDLFEEGASKKPHSADHWKLKPNYSKYSGRLFLADANGREQIREKVPFHQGDLSPSNIYVLDAFFELYIIVGARAQSQYASFRIALDFAQEYSILAAGVEDRPFVPFATVVLEGIPRDLKSVFRKWTDARSPTVMNQAGPTSGPGSGSGSGSGGLKRGRSLRVVTLSQALQALGE